MNRSSTFASRTVRLALSVTLVVFVALIGGGLYAAHRHDDLRAFQSAVQWQSLKANNEAQRLSIFAERYFSGDASVELTVLQTRHAALMKELTGLREGPYADDLLAYADLEARFGALEAELAGLGNLLKGVSRDDRVALRDVRLCLENAVLALSDAVTVAVRQMAGPRTASYWGSLLNVLYLSIIVAAGGLVFLAAVVISENTKNLRLADQYRQALENADMANRAKSRMLANVSHELRTPLNAIIGFSDILRDQNSDALGNDRHRQYLGYIRDSGTHLLMLVNDLLNYAKHDDESERLNFQPIQIIEILQEAIEIGRTEAGRPDAIVDLDRTFSPTVLADGAAVRLIAGNLIANAVRHSPADAAVDIGLSVRPDPLVGGDRVTIQVRDRGPGLSDQDADRLLHPFELLQSDSFIAGPDDDAGFGMALAHKLAEKHGDGVALQSREGGGTVAAFSLLILAAGDPGKSDATVA